MAIRAFVMSDIHIEMDQHLVERAQQAAAMGSSRSMGWWEHLRDRRNIMPSHPFLGPDLYDAIGADLLLLAGDIGVGAEMTAGYAIDASRFLGCPVCLCLGNHDFYDGVEMGKTIADIRAIIAASKGARVHLLDNERTDFEVRGRHLAVLGGTTWTDYCLNRESCQGAAMAEAERGLNDHRLIRYQGRRFRPQDALELHQKARAWLSVAAPVARAESDVLVVMTHHGMTPMANPPRYRGGKLSPAFASNMELEIRSWGADLVIHGHTHSNVDVAIGNSRVLSHQRGYLGMDEDELPPANTFLPLLVECDDGQCRWSCALNQDEVDMLLFGRVEPIVPLTEEERARKTDITEGIRVIESKDGGDHV